MPAEKNPNKSSFDVRADVSQVYGNSASNDYMSFPTDKHGCENKH
jgi:hypothetical protein